MAPFLFGKKREGSWPFTIMPIAHAGFGSRVTLSSTIRDIRDGLKYSPLDENFQGELR